MFKRILFEYDVTTLLVRFHSFYPWHTGRDYQHLETEADKEILKWVTEFK